MKFKWEIRVFERDPLGRITAGIQRLYRQADDGWRLGSVQLEHDPLNHLPETITLVRYGYDRQGQLTSVHDRAGQLVREFEWTRRRISAHRIKGGPWHRYRYAGVEPDVRVVAQSSEEGLGYKFQYKAQPPSPKGKPRSMTTVTDSLKRVNIYCFEGDKGLSRLVEHQRADGSTVRYQYDGYGRQHASTDALGRTSYIAYNGSGDIVGTQQPGDAEHPTGLRTSQRFDRAGYVTESQDQSGATTEC